MQKRDLRPKDGAERPRAAGRGAERHVGRMKAGSHLPLRPSCINTFFSPLPKPLKSLGVSRGDAGCLGDHRLPRPSARGWCSPGTSDGQGAAPAKPRGSGASPGPRNASFAELLGVRLPESGQRKDPSTTEGIDSPHHPPTGIFGVWQARQSSSRIRRMPDAARPASPGSRQLFFPSPSCYYPGQFI